MKILNISPALHAGADRFPCVATFDAEIAGTLRLYGLRLLKSPSGRLLTYAPKTSGKRCATFAPDLADQITAAAIAALGGRAAHAAD